MSGAGEDPFEEAGVHSSITVQRINQAVRILKPILYTVTLLEIVILLRWERYELDNMQASMIPLKNDTDLHMQQDMFYVEREELDAFGSFVALITLMGLGLLFFHSLIILILYVALRTATQIWITSRMDYDNGWDFALIVIGVMETVLFHIYVLLNVTRIYLEYRRLREIEMWRDFAPNFSIYNSDMVLESMRNASLHASPLKGPNGSRESGGEEDAPEETNPSNLSKDLGIKIKAQKVMKQSLQSQKSIDMPATSIKMPDGLKPDPNPKPPAPSPLAPQRSDSNNSLNGEIQKSDSSDKSI